MEAQDDCGKWRQVPAFGDWNMWEEMPVTQYFEPAAAAFFFTAQAGEDDVDLFKVPHFAANPYTYKKCVVRVKKGVDDEPNMNAGAVPGRRKKHQQQQHGKKEQQRRKKPKAKTAAAAVDEDLYKISPNVICKVQKKKLLRNLLGGCLGINCIA